MYQLRNIHTIKPKSKMKAKLTTNDYLVFLETLKEQTEKNNIFSMTAFCNSLNVKPTVGRLLVQNNIISMNNVPNGTTTVKGRKNYYTWISKISPNLKMAESLKNKIKNFYIEKNSQYRGGKTEKFVEQPLETPLETLFTQPILNEIKEPELNINYNAISQNSYIRKTLDFLKGNKNKRFMRIEDSTKRMRIGKSNIFISDIPNEDIVNYIRQNVVINAGESILIYVELRELEGPTSRKKDGFTLTVESKEEIKQPLRPDNYIYHCNYCGKPYIPNRRHAQLFCNDSCRSGSHIFNKKQEDDKKMKPTVEDYKEMFENIDNWEIGEVKVHHSHTKPTIQECIEILKATGEYRIQKIVYQVV